MFYNIVRTPEHLPISPTAAEPSHHSYAAKLISPSGMSLFLCLLVGLTVPLTTLFLAHYNNSLLKEQLAYWEATRQHEAAQASLAGTSASTHVAASTPSTEMTAMVSTVLLWSVVAAISIVAAITIIKALRSLYFTTKELRYVNQDRSMIIRETIVSLIASLLAVASIIGLTILLFKRVTVWSVEQTSSVAKDLPLATAALRILAVTLALAALLHLFVVLTRLALLRTRVL